MCGIVGMLGNLTTDLVDSQFRDFMEVCATRGRDSTGTVRVSKDKSYSWAKEVGSPTHLFETRKYERFIRTPPSLPAALIGHCRAKTVGQVSILNAHPFDFEDKGIIGVHNGTLRNYSQSRHYSNGMVDSEVMYAAIAYDGLEKAIETIRGAYCLVWYNKSEGAVHFLRNKERPLWFTYNKDMSVLFWASERWMFGAIERRIELWSGCEQNGVTYDKFFPLPEDTHWSFVLNPFPKKGEEYFTQGVSEKCAPKTAEVSSGYAPMTGVYHGTNTGHQTVSNKYGKYLGGKWRSARDLESMGLVWDSVTLNWEPVEKGVVVGKVGGEVSDPFLKSQSPENSEDCIPISEVSYLKNSPRTTLPVPTFTQSSIFTTYLSLPSSRLTPTKKGVPVSGISAMPSMTIKPDESTSDTTHKIVHGKRSGLSHRVVTGIDYLTNNETGQEYAFSDLLIHSKGCCKFCKKPINSYRQVSYIKNKSSIFCNECIPNN